MSQTTSAIRAYSLFAALMIHSVIEGLGFGSADTSRMALTVLVAIVCHKGLAAFALAQTMLLQQGGSRREGLFSGRGGRGRKLRFMLFR